jgi:hypothetical protein
VLHIHNIIATASVAICNAYCQVKELLSSCFRKRLGPVINSSLSYSPHSSPEAKAMESDQHLFYLT